ncbi:cold-shock protein [Bradyrhizobium sp. DASA03005]|uniref:cold-shock protein n=1 Tax=Bradyrhizobium sp. SPXBL-02 TaxID=3395912 RepID=UPI003F719356
MVKWFNAANGYGIIKPDRGGVDLFVQIRGVEKARYAALAEGSSGQQLRQSACKSLRIG